MDDDQAKASAYQTGEINILQGAPSEIAESYEGKDDLSIREVPQTNYILFNINENHLMMLKYVRHFHWH